MFTANIESKELLLYDVIGEEWDGSGIHAGIIDEVLNEIGENERVTIRINSPGGVADEGIAIYNRLKRHKGGVDTVVDSLAASAASIIALAGETRTVLTGGRFMIHRAMGGAIGNAQEMRKLAEILEVYDSALADIYAEHVTGFDKASILDMMTEESWFDASASLELGLATALDPQQAKEPAKAAWFNNAPKDIADLEVSAKLHPKPIARELARLKLRLR